MDRYARAPLDFELGLPPLPEPPPEVGIVVELTVDGVLQVRLLGAGAPGAVAADFRSADFERRLSEGKNGLLGRGVGLAKGERPIVWDATAGLGRDAVRLVALGSTVVAFERDPVVHALFADGIARASTVDDSLTEALRTRLTLRAEDAVSAFRAAVASGEPRPDVIFLDPMFPERGSALAKKEAQILGALCGEGGNRDEDRELFAAAEAVGAKRILVKRPRHAPTIVPDREPAHRFEGKSVRYDLYLA